MTLLVRAGMDVWGWHLSEDGIKTLCGGLVGSTACEAERTQAMMSCLACADAVGIPTKSSTMDCGDLKHRVGSRRVRIEVAQGTVTGMSLRTWTTCAFLVGDVMEGGKVDCLACLASGSEVLP